MPASTLSRGGAGVSFEQQVGALQLVALLTGGASIISGESTVVTSVEFQSATLAVDDLHLTGVDSNGRQLQAIVGIRRDPTIAAGDTKFVALLSDFLTTFMAQHERFSMREMKAWLVVASPHTGALDLAVLTDLARDSTSADGFEQLVAGRNASVRRRLEYLTEAIDAAAVAIEPAAAELAGSGREAFIWKFLRGLGVSVVDVEQDAARDRADAIDRLSALTNGDLGVAATLWAELCTVVVRHNPTGATLDEAALRHELTTPVGPGRRHAELRERLQSLEDAARARIKDTLEWPGPTGADAVRLRLPRTAEVSRVVAAAADAPSTHLLITGNSDIGKSVVGYHAIATLQDAGAFALVVNAEDLTGLGSISDPFAGRLEELLATSTTASDRFLLVDGAEAGVLDDRLVHLLRAAIAARYRCLVVCRDDVVEDIAGQVQDTAGVGNVHTHRVNGLTEDEVAEVVAAFPALAGIAQRPNAAEHLARPGLVDVLLRSDPARGVRGRGVPRGDNSDPMSELEVFSRYWARVVDVRRATASAAGRTDTVIQIAGRVLQPSLPLTPVDGHAVDSLRSDGILAASNPFVQAITFASDLDRDYALVSLLRREGLQLLASVVQPRYVLRAARLAVQAQLAHDGYSAMGALRTALREVAGVHGNRWTELADEGLLGHPQAAELLAEAWPTLSTDPARLGALLAAARRLYYPSGWAHTGRLSDPGPNLATPALRPLVEVLVAHDAIMTELDGDLFKQYQDFLLAYLRGLRVHRWPPADEHAVVAIQQALAARPDNYRLRPPSEAVALLVAVDEDWATTQLLARVADHPLEVVDALESPYSQIELARRAPETLADLTRLYYVDPADRGYGAGDGIRDHSFEWSGIASSPNLGPFAVLLAVAPARGTEVVQVVLHHAAEIRQRQMTGLHSSMDSWRGEHGTPAELHTRDPVILDLPGLAGQPLVGDSQTWHWHRGTGVGPAPALSAAMAYERSLQRRLDGGADIDEVLDEVYASATTLTEVGIAQTLLMRNRPTADARLAQTFRERLVSELEIGRLQQEYRNAGSERDDPWRSLAPNAVAQTITVTALANADADLLQALPLVADQLEAANTDPDGHVAPEIRLTASLLRPDTFTFEPHEDGGVLAIPRIPEEVEAELSGGNAQLDQFMVAMKLHSDYSPADVHRHPLRSWAAVDPADADGTAARQQRETPDEFALRFPDDLAAAKRLAENPDPLSAPVVGAGPACAVAGFVLRLADPSLVSAGDREWARDLLIAHASDSSPYEDRSTTDARAPSRAAARALPFSLAELELSPAKRLEITSVLAELARHHVLEVREALVAALRTAWAAPCTGDRQSCHHGAAIDLIAALHADAVLPDHRDQSAPVVTDLDTLATADPERLDLGALAVAAAAAIDLDAFAPSFACGRVAPEVALELMNKLTTLVAGVSAIGRRDGDGIHQMAEAALRADDLHSTGPDGAVGKLAHLLLTASVFDWWRTALFDVVREHPELAARLSSMWVQLAGEIVDVLRASATPLNEQEQVQLAAVIPPTLLAPPLDPRLDGLLGEWLPLASGNTFATDEWTNWAVLNDFAAAEILDSLDSLLDPDGPVPSNLRSKAALFTHLLAGSLSTSDQQRAYRWIDKLVAAGHEELRPLVPEE